MDASEWFWRLENSFERVSARKIFIDIAGDLVTGILLSQIVYWFRPYPDGTSKLRIERDGSYWLAKRRTDWWRECRLTPKQADRALKVLERRKLVQLRVYKFKRVPTIHIRLRLSDLSRRVKSMISPKGENLDLPQRVKSIGTTSDVQKGGIQPVKISGGKTSGEAAGVLEAFKKKDAAETATPLAKVVTGPLLMKLWRGVVAHHHDTQGVMKPFTVAEQAMFKRIVRTLGSESGRITTWVIVNWSLFMKLVKEEHGVQVTASLPSAPLFLKYIDTAQRGANKPAPKAAEPVQLIAPPAPSKKSKKNLAPLSQVEADVKGL